MRTINFRDALNEALHEEMERDDSVFVLGEDVITHGGPYAVTQGIDERFPGRIMETPIAEAGIVGLGVGAAMAGMRPVVELMYLDFVTCAMDEVVNQAAKMRYMTGGQANVPLVIRLPCGHGGSWRRSTPRLWSPGSCMFPGYRWSCPPPRAMPKDCSRRRYAVPIRCSSSSTRAATWSRARSPMAISPSLSGQADVKREGGDATVIAIGPMVQKALEAGALLEDDGYDIEIVDPRTPRSARLRDDLRFGAQDRASRGLRRGLELLGAVAEISAMISESCFADLKAPVVRIGSPHVPMPFSGELVKYVVPEASNVVSAVQGTMA